MRADLRLDYDVITVAQPHKLYLLVRLLADADDLGQRPPLNLSLVVDRSSSMAGRKIAYTREAAQFLVRNLSSRDLLSIVLYDATVDVLQAPAFVANKDLLAQRIAAVRTGSMTNLSGGWLQGCNLVAQEQDDVHLNRVILMSDGHANRGISDAATLEKLARQKHDDGISTTTMGLGERFNEDLLMKMASAGGGSFYFIESPEVAPEIIREELQGLLSLVGQNLVVSLHMSDHISGVRQLNAYDMQENQREVAFHMGDIYSEEEKALLLELMLPPLEEIGVVEVGKLRVEYDEFRDAGAEHQVIELPVTVHVAADGKLPPDVNADVKRSVLLLQAANARQSAVRAADSGDFRKSSQVLREAAQAIVEAEVKDAELEEEHDALIDQAAQMDKGAAHYGERHRKTMATESLYTMTSRHQGTQALRRRDAKRAGDKQQLLNDVPGITPTTASWNDHSYPLENDLIRIGRAPQNEIVIALPNVSRFHCQIIRDGDRLILEDLDSTNGTFLGEIRLEGPYVLKSGDEILVDDQKLVFHTG